MVAPFRELFALIILDGDADLPQHLLVHLADRRSQRPNRGRGIYGLEQLFQALGGQIFRLDGDYDPVGSSQGVDREHPQGGLTINQDMGILSLERVQILPQDSLSAHGIHQRDLHTGELDVSGHQVNAFRVVQDTLSGA